MRGAKLSVEKGTVYGLLTIVYELPAKRLPSGQINRIIMCRCQCGVEKNVRLLHLVRGRTISCGCQHGEHHGEAGGLLYNVWRGMKNRCYSETYPERHLYFDRGIIMCCEWKKSYTSFRDWAQLNGWKHGLQIDRIDTNGNYEPFNCRFVTPKQNCNNRRCTRYVNYNGVLVPLTTLLAKMGLERHYAAIRTRIMRGWKHQKAIDTPLRQGNYKRKS